MRLVPKWVGCTSHAECARDPAHSLSRCRVGGHQLENFHLSRPETPLADISDMRFAHPKFMNVVSMRRTHAGLMLAARITLAHFSVSSAMNLVKSAGDNASTVPPKSA